MFSVAAKDPAKLLIFGSEILLDSPKWKFSSVRFVTLSWFRVKNLFLDSQSYLRN